MFNIKSWFDTVIELYANVNFPYQIAGWMLFVGVLLIALAAIETLIKWLAVRKRTQILKETYKDCEGKVEECREKFAVEFVQIDNALKRPSRPNWFVKGLHLAWSEFAESFIDDQSNLKLVRNTVRPQDFFLRAISPPNWLNFWANLAVGIGLFFTFFGLVAALSFANEGVASGDMTKMSTSLASLLAAASAKFVTSIMGVGLSIVLKLFHKGFSASLRTSIYDLCHKLETGLLYVAPQTIANQQLEQAKDQTAIIKEQANEIGMQFREQLAPLNETLANSAEAQRRAIEDGIGNMVGDAVNAEINSMGEVLSQLSDTLDGLGDGLKASGDSASTQIRDATAELIKTQKAFADSANDLAKIGPVLERWEEATGTAADNIASTMSSFQSAIVSLEAASTQMESANTQLRDHIDASDTRIQAGADAVRHANDGATTLITSLVGTQAKMSTQFQNYEARFSDVDESLGEAVQGLAGGYKNYQNAVNENLKTLDSQLGAAISGLADIISDIREIIEDTDAVKRNTKR